MNYAPVIMFVYNREDHFKKTYEALAKCPEARDTVLYVFSDGAKNSQSEAAVEKVRDAVRYKIKNSDFKKVVLNEASCNRGLAVSIIGGVSEVLNQYGKAIIIEDDCMASPYLLSFFNKSLDYYENNNKVGAIAGYTPNISLPNEYTSDVFATYRSCSCCWATWKNKWEG